MWQAAVHDALTGLATRASFDASLRQALSRRSHGTQCAALLVIDIDLFKAVNNTYGHTVGDTLLQLTADRLNALVRASGVVARLGGDEFAILLSATDVGTALALAHRAFDVLGAPASLDGNVVAVSVSVGVYFTDTEVSSEEALRSVDAALVAAKSSGSGVELFNPTKHRHLLDRFRLALELRTAVPNGEFVLYYQPIFELATRQTVKAEALIRWNHPVQGLLNPSQFIEIAEDSGAIIEVGRWVLRQGCADAKKWQTHAGGRGVGVALNVSRLQLRSPTLVDDVYDAVNASGLDPDLVTLEITETALMSNTAEMIAVLTRLKGLGVHLAMDDFGTGYSSLAHLRALPIDLLKIDKAFIDGIAREAEEWAVAAAIIRLAGSLGKRTLAEGIEKASQLAHLRALGCELGQGWLIARAAPFEELVSFLDGNRR